MFQNQTNEFQIILKALSYFKTHWWLFALEVMLIYTVSLMKFYRTDPVYESTATILIDSSRRQLYQSVMMPGSTNLYNARKQNMVHLLSSQEVFERFRKILSDYYKDKKQPNYLKSFFPGDVAMPAENFRPWVSLSWDKNSDIYSIRCTAKTPDAAHAICLAYMNTMQAYYPEIGPRDILMKRDFLAKQIASLTEQLTEKEFYLAEFQKKNEDFINFLMINIEGRGVQKIRSQLFDLKQRISANRAVKSLLLQTPQAKKGN